MNDSAGDNRWIELQLQGTASNRDGIGARVKVVAGGKAQYDHVTFAVGYASSSAGPLHFGLGSAKSVDLVEIRWALGACAAIEGPSGQPNCSGERTSQVIH